ncbi:type II secretion system protein GspM [Legionella jordanis]|uniref:Putative general secretion pathway protein YghD n=1 Tax=Legionella jordanis TaxID=456 RepID=A0A0W0VE57_9GAMM|nr:type II secretion system protein GspM [Legionella jordanis]KTD18435.1 putative general secretion pathway protein YghD [Legionella jordanis]RMX05340.1 type II secretion system protein M [Legionella jordanis]RMX20812.1 type II secretion system protein M [Legionella jordanis]VEH13217.1 general secretion pathway protein M [Legionella jordanis]HAT8715008.1 type II secretion system protein M [Legionella jordanis]
MISHYWSNLNERERWMLSIAAICLIFYLIYILIYSPITSTVESKTSQLREKKETLAWMEQVSRQPKNKKTPQAINQAKLLALIDSQLSNNDLRPFVHQLQQISSGDIELTFEQVPYIAFLSWLWTLSSDYAITLKQLSAERTETAGVVKVMVVIATK